MEEILTGRSTSHLIPYKEFFIHRQILLPFQNMREAALKVGFDIRPVSIFRSYEQQLTIWNEKAQGIRPLLDINGKALDYLSLSPHKILSAILRWSGIPGASRHHWGTELDVYDHRALEKGKRVELTPQETAGPFAPLHSWLDENLQRFHFFRPYDRDRGGVAPERWHLSYGPISQQYFKQYDFELFKQLIHSPRLQLRDLIQERAEEIFRRYVCSIAHCHSMENPR